ncbi:MAG: amidase, partial [Cyanobacteria bacterium Co-bin13]|nr:amidase [Cyanobacteria bacterium Co-bin13]
AALIEQAARIYGEGPSMLWLGQGLQRQPTGGNVFRACSLLPIATGQIGKPGTGLLYMNGFANRGIDPDYIAASHLQTGAPRSISHMDLAEHLADPQRSQALMCWNNNIVASSPQQQPLRQALEREDLFTVCLELFATDTTDYADIVLPAASFLEFDDLVLSYFNYSVSAQVKTIEPLGEALPNQEVFRRLAAALGLSEPELFESDRAILDTLLRQTGLPLTFSQLAQLGTVDYRRDPVIPFADLTFATPSQRIEIATDRFVAAGLPYAPQPFADQRPAAERLRLLSPASPWLMNSSYGNDSGICDRIQPADVLIHPQEAATRGLKSGDPVLLVNETGQLPLQVALSDRVPCGVALVYKGRWPKLSPGQANVNILNPGHKTDLAESSCVHAIEVDLIPLTTAKPDPSTTQLASPSTPVSTMSHTALTPTPAAPSSISPTLKTALCIRHVAFEDLGSFEPILQTMGYQVTYLEAGAENLKAIDPLQPDLLVALGGPIGVYEAAAYPFIADEVALLAKRLAADLPTLGLCLGCQMMAEALGARVYPSGRKEIGWSPLILSEAGRQSALAELAPELTPVVHWHGDTFDLPEGAVHLASTAEFENQAFSWGRNGLALQFHPEVTRQGLERWFIGHTLEISTTAGIDVVQLRQDTERWGSGLEARGAAFIKRWLNALQFSNSADPQPLSLQVAKATFSTTGPTQNGGSHTDNRQTALLPLPATAAAPTATLLPPAPATDELAYLSATELIQYYRDRTLSPVEVARAVLRRIERYNPLINAFRLIDEQTTLVMAQASEARWRRGEPCGLLDGVPISIKDLVNVQGWSTLRGSRALDPNQIWATDAPVTARLREHGAVFIGKTTTPESGCKVVTQSPLTGITRNPWDLSKTPGGSSGGAAAALASGLGPLAVGTDGAGSIRIPASFCNVFGLKPTWGRVPVAPVSTFGRMSTIGPMSRTVTDAALMYSVITQPDSRDCFALPNDQRNYLEGLETGVRGLRIAYSPDLGQPCKVDPEVEGLVAKAVQSFTALGAHVEKVDLKWKHDLMEVFLPLWYAYYANFLRLYTPEQIQKMDPDLVAIAMAGQRLSLLDYFEAVNRKGLIAAQMQEVFNQYDLLITPTMPVVPFEATQLCPDNTSDDWSWVPFTYLFNLTEQPAASIPCGFTKAGLPVGLQIAGPLYSDALILRASRCFEMTQPLYKHHPVL